MNYDEHQYLQLISNILINGDEFQGRNGNTKMIFGTQMRFQLSDNVLPLLTTKKLAWKTCLKELLWFISGSTNNKTLKEQKVHIWDANGSKEFLNSRGLDYQEDDLGPVYGHQWRFFNASYIDCNTDYTGWGVDQLDNIIQMLKDPKEKYSRRIILSAWNPCQLHLMALPPCHILMHFHVNQQDELSCILYQRSGDVGLGVPFNIASYSFLTHLLAHHCGLKAKEFIHFIGNAHIYNDHIEPLKTQLNRTPYAFPSLKITNKYDNINDYKLEDFVVENYQSYEKITMQMSA
jgi:thymidylate synthase